MSGPWEDYADPAPAAPAGASPGPWQDYGGGAPDPDAHVDPYGGVKIATNKDEILSGLKTLTGRGVSPDVIRSYVADSNGHLPQKSQDWLDGPYAEAIKGGKGLPTDFQPMEPTPEIGPVTAATYGLTSAATRGWDDELSAALGSGLGLGNTPLGKAVGLDTYGDIVNDERKRKEAAWDQHPWAYAAGFVPGMMVGPKGGEQADTLMGRLAQSFARGGLEGAATAAGNSDSGNTSNFLEDTLTGGMVGGPLGVIAHPLGVLAQNLVGRGAKYLPSSIQVPDWVPGIGGNSYNVTGRNALNTGLDALDDHMGGNNPAQRAADMRARQQQMTDAGVNPTLTDVVDAQGRSVIRDAASKQTPAREAVVSHAQDVAQNVQHDVRRSTNELISDAPHANTIAGDVNTARDNAMETAMAPIRGQPIPITEDMQQVFATREGQAALRAAEGLSIDPAQRAEIRNIMGAARAKPPAPVDPDGYFAKNVPGWNNMSEAGKAQIRAQMPDKVIPEAKSPWEGVNLSLDTADKFARAMQGRSTNNPGLERVVSNLSNTVRNAAKDANAGYKDALGSYSAASKVSDAATGTGKYEDTHFLNSTADQYGRKVDAGNGALSIAPDGLDTSELDALRARARDEINQTAGDNAGQGARATARQLSRGAEQQSKNEALLGPEGAQKLQDRMGAIETKARNAEYINPNTNSQTFSRGQDAMVDGFTTAVHATTSKWGAVHAAGKWLKQGGIRGVDAERLARDAISNDPDRVSAAIDYLEQKGLARARAQRFMQSYASGLGGRLAGAVATPENTYNNPANSYEVKP